jgi:hypothetical protein
MECERFSKRVGWKTLLSRLGKKTSKCLGRYRPATTPKVLYDRGDQWELWVRDLKNLSELVFTLFISHPEGRQGI